MDQNKIIGKIVLYRDLTPKKIIPLCVEPQEESFELAHLKNGDTVEIVEKIVKDTSIPTIKANGYPTYTIWHKVKYQDKQDKIGYINSDFIEMPGEERNTIINLIQNTARKGGVDPIYATALAGCESHFKPYSTSGTGAMGIFQLTGDARKQLTKKLKFPIGNSEVENFDPSKNIEGAIVYLNWLFSKNEYGGRQDEYKKVTAAWNAGNSVVPKDGPITYSHIPIAHNKRLEAKRLVSRVEKNRKKKDWGHIVSMATNISVATNALLFAVLGTLPITLGANIHTLQHNDVVKTSIDTPVLNIASAIYPSERQIDEQEFEFQPPQSNTVIKVVNEYATSTGDFTTSVTVSFTDHSRPDFNRKYLGFTVNSYLYDVSNSWKLVTEREEGQSIYTSILHYNADKKTFDDIKFLDKGQPLDDTLCCTYMNLLEDGDGERIFLPYPDESHLDSERVFTDTYVYNKKMNAFIQI
jgi:hypothetical protein